MPLCCRRSEPAVAGARSAASGPQSADADIFGLGIFLDAIFAAFTADAGLLEAAEGRHFRSDQSLIDADNAIFQIAHDPESAAQVRRVEIAGKPIFGGIGQANDLFFGLEAED